MQLLCPNSRINPRDDEPPIGFDETLHLARGLDKPTQRLTRLSGAVCCEDDLEKWLDAAPEIGPQLESQISTNMNVRSHLRALPERPSP